MKKGGPRSTRVLDRGGCVSRPHVTEGKPAGRDQEGREGVSDPPSPLPVLGRPPPPQGNSGQAPRLQKSPPCVWPPSLAAASNHRPHPRGSSWRPSHLEPEEGVTLPPSLPPSCPGVKERSPQRSPRPPPGEAAWAVGTESVCHRCCRPQPHPRHQLSCSPGRRHAVTLLRGASSSETMAGSAPPRESQPGSQGGSGRLRAWAPGPPRRAPTPRTRSLVAHASNSAHPPRTATVFNGGEGA